MMDNLSLSLSHERYKQKWGVFDISKGILCFNVEISQEGYIVM